MNNRDLPEVVPWPQVATQKNSPMDMPAHFPGPPHPRPIRNHMPDESHRMWEPACERALMDRKGQLGRFADSRALQWIDCMLEQVSRIRPAVTKSQIEVVRGIAQSFPNFSDYIDWIVRSLEFSEATDMPVMIRPHLLLGEPGLGKSFVVKKLAKALGLYFGRLSLPDVTASFVLTGATSTWTSAQHGYIAHCLSEGPVPWVVMDELDKCQSSADSRFPITPTLLSLLETSTAQDFRDEFLQINMDVTPYVYSFTANTLLGIEPALLSRLEVFKIELPQLEDMPSLVRSVDAVLRKEDARIDRLFRPLSEEIQTLFPRMSARDVKKVLAMSYAGAYTKREGQTAVITTTIVAIEIESLLSVSHQPRSIGFHA